MIFLDLFQPISTFLSLILVRALVDLRLVLIRFCLMKDNLGIILYRFQRFVADFLLCTIFGAHVSDFNLFVNWFFKVCLVDFSLGFAHSCFIQTQSRHSPWSILTLVRWSLGVFGCLSVGFDKLLFDKTEFLDILGLILTIFGCFLVVCLADFSDDFG